MAQSYTRQSTFADGDTITASLFNNEYDQLVNAFSYSSTNSTVTGHRHDGTAGEGGNIFKIGDLDFLNKIEVDDVNNRWGIYVEVTGVSTEQVRFQDGSIVPVTTNDIDLGSGSLQFKDLFIDGTASIDSLALSSGSTVDVILDEDDLVSDSATALATQQSIKAYVDSQVTAQDLDFQADTGGALNIDLDSETLVLAGGTGIDTSGALNTVTIAIDATVATLADAQTLTNKTIDAASNTLSNIANASLTNSTVSYGGVQLSLGGVDATPAFDLVDATGYLGDSALVTTGALNSGSITSGFGSIDVGSSSITTLGTVSGGTLTGTLSTAAQANVTSLGTLTSLDIAGDLTVDTSTLKVDSANNRVGILNAAPDVTLDIGSATDAVHVPVGTTAQRPGTPAAGYFRYNADLEQFEGYTDTWGAIGGGGTNTFTFDSFTGDNTTVDFVLSQATNLEGNLIVFIDGVFQTQDAYTIATVSGITTLTFSAAPATGRYIAVYTVAAGVSGNNMNLDSFSGDGATTDFTLSINAINENNTQIFIDGVYQQKDGYTVTNTTLSFSAAPPLNSTIEVMTFTQTEVNVPVDNSIEPIHIKAGDFYFDTDTLYIDSVNNRVGVGTSSPNNLFHIYESGSGDATLEIDNTQSGTSTIVGKQGSSAYGATAAGNAAFYTYDNDISIMADGGAGNTSSIKFSTGGNTERMRIDASGNVGINRQSISQPSAGATTLAIQGTVNDKAGAIRLYSADDSVAAYIYPDNTSGLSINTSTSHPIIFRTVGTEAMHIDVSGNVGIGVTPSDWWSNATALQISPTGAIYNTSDFEDFNLATNAYYNSSGIESYIQNDAACKIRLTDAGLMDFRVAASGTADTAISWTTAMTIDASGNVLVGKTANDNSTVGGSIRAGESSFVAGDSRALTIVRTTNDGSLADFRQAGTTVGTIGTNLSAMYIGTGDVGLFTQSANDRILPYDPSTNGGRDAAIDFGSSSTRFKDLYLSGGVVFPDAGSSGTATSNSLDSYEEGTWTPTFDNGVGDLSATSLAFNASGRYTKIGRVVYITGVTSTSGSVTGTASSPVNITGLPFTVGGVSIFGGVFVDDSPSYNKPLVRTTSGEFEGGATIITLKKDGADDEANFLTSDLAASGNSNRIYISGFYTIS